MNKGQAKKLNIKFPLGYFLNKTLTFVSKWLFFFFLLLFSKQVIKSEITYMKKKHILLLVQSLQNILLNKWLMLLLSGL